MACVIVTARVNRVTIMTAVRGRAGGTVVCMGADCTVAFHRATFAACSVIAIRGASATLIDCCSRGATVATYATDPQTTLTLDHCDVVECSVAACVGTGATLATSHVTCMCASEVGIDAWGEGTVIVAKATAILDGCTAPPNQQAAQSSVPLARKDVEGLVPAAAETVTQGCGHNAPGMHVRAGAAVWLQECTFGGMREGLVASGARSRIEAKDCGFRGPRECAVVVGAAARAELHNCKVTEAGEVGVHACGSGSVVTMRSCMLAKSGMTSLLLRGGATGELTDCTCRPTATASALQVSGGASKLSADTCTLQGGGTEAAVAATDGGKIALKGCAVRAESHDTMDAKGAIDRLETAEAAGVVAEGPRSEVRLEGGTVTTVRRSSLSARDGGKIFAATVHVRCLESRRSKRMQTAAMSAALAETQTLSAAAANAIAAGKGGTGTVEDIQDERGTAHSIACSTHGPHGLHSDGGGSSVSVKGCVVEVEGGCGITASGGAGIVASSCTIGQVAETLCSRNGVFVWGPKSAVELFDCLIQNVADCGVLVAGGAAASVQKTTVRGAKRMHGLASAGKGSVLVAEDCVLEDAGGSGVAVEAAATAMLDTVDVLGTRAGHGIAARGRGVRVTARGCKVVGALASGVYAGEGAAVFAEGCDVRSANGDGFLVRPPGCMPLLPQHSTCATRCFPGSMRIQAVSTCHIILFRCRVRLSCSRERSVRCAL